MTNPSVVLCLDVSGSMGPSQRNYLPLAVTDAGTFLYIMQTGDSLGITSFSDNGAINYPASGTLVQVINSVSDQDAAKRILNDLTALDMTNTAAGLTVSAGLLAGAAAPRAIVLLSDGQWNQGVDPVSILPFNPPIPVYTILLGPLGNVQSLKDIADKTGGKWHVVNNPINLQAVYNEIVAQTQVASVAASEEQQVPQMRFWTLSGAVPAGAPWATFAVSWTDPTATFTPTTPTGNQVNVSLTDPNNNTTNPAPYATGGGFVVFKVQSPLAGPWQTTIWSSSPQNLGTTGGVFTINTGLQLVADVSQDATVGQALPIAATVRTADGSQVPDALISASIEKPAMAPEAALAKHRDRLDALDFPESAGEISDNVRMLTLQAQLGDSETLLPYHHVPLAVTRGESGSRQAEFTPDTRGSHTLWLTATGNAPDGGSFSLRRRISIWADHPAATASASSSQPSAT